MSAWNVAHILSYFHGALLVNFECWQCERAAWVFFKPSRLVTWVEVSHTGG